MSSSRVPPLVVAGPSGVGKGTLLNRLQADFPSRFGFSISYTSRPPRPGEVDGRHYWFVSREKFLDKISANHFLECAENFGNLYGTAWSEVQRIQELQQICLLEVDIQGVRQIKEWIRASHAVQGGHGENDEAAKESPLAPHNAPPCVPMKQPSVRYVFIEPPNLEELEIRLRTRASETEEDINKRLHIAQKEMAAAATLEFDLVLQNAALDTCYEALKKAVTTWYPSLVLPG